VLDVLRTTEYEQNIFFWRDKSGREIDFVIKRSTNSVDTIECKINPDNFNFNNLREFRKFYPNGKNYCISPFIVDKYTITRNNLTVEFVPLSFNKV